MKTRAAIFVEHGQPLVVDEVDLPELGPTQVTVKLFASGICRLQLHHPQPAANVPCVLGHEPPGPIAAAITTSFGKENRPLQGAHPGCATVFG